MPQPSSLRSGLPQQKGLTHKFWADIRGASAAWETEFHQEFQKSTAAIGQTSCAGTAQSKSFRLTGLPAHSQYPCLRKRLLLKEPLPNEHPMLFPCMDRLWGPTLLKHFLIPCDLSFYLWTQALIGHNTGQVAIHLPGSLMLPLKPSDFW